MNRTFVLLGSVSILALGAALIAKSQETKDGSLDLLRKDFRSYFEIEGDCDLITFKGGPEEVAAFWEDTAHPLIDGMVEVLSPSTDDPDEISRITLQYIFTECPWPAPVGRPDLQALQQAVRSAVA